MRPHVIANRCRGGRTRRSEIRRLLDRLLDLEGRTRPVSIVLVGERTIRRLNRDWLGEDRPTDVLSFPMGSPPGPPPAAVPMGEVVVCIPVCAREAARRGVALHLEVARMIIHGTYHLLGYDHATRAETTRMRGRERRLLSWYRGRGIEVIEG